MYMNPFCVSPVLCGVFLPLLLLFHTPPQIPGGSLEESEVLKGVMVNKDVTHAKMRRRIENPRIILLDCPLEYKKGESMV